MFSKIIPSHLVCTENTERTNVGFRVANFLHTMKGRSDYAGLAFYTTHLEKMLDEVPEQESNVGLNANNEQVTSNHVKTDARILRGAIGPRITNWVGCHQLQESIDINYDTKDDEEFVSPVGVNQLEAVYQDLREHGLVHSTMMIRDPALDFDDSNDIPELISATFSMIQGAILSYMQYETIDMDSNVINEIWAFNLISCLYNMTIPEHRETDYHSLTVNYFPRDNKSLGDRSVLDLPFKKSYLKNEFDSNITVFLEDLDLLERVDMAVRNSFQPDSFDNDDISVYYLIESIERKLVAEVVTPLMKDMCYALIIYAVSKGEGYQTNINRLLSKMSESVIREECLIYVGVQS